MREWAELFLRIHGPKLSRQTQYASLIRRHFAPLMNVTPRDLTRQAVEQWFSQIGLKSHTQANHALTALKSIYNRMKDWGVYEGPLPTERIKPFRIQSRARFVQPEEMPRILDALRPESEDLQLLFLLCLIVGCRPGEALRMKWADVRFVEELVREPQADGSCSERKELVATWHKPMTKNGLSHTIPIPTVLATRLYQLPRVTEWVFSGCINHPRRNDTGPLSYSMVHKHWTEVRKRAKLPDVRVYDLRRTCASWLAINGENTVLIAQVLNHTSLQHTHIYARLNTAPVSRALSQHEEQVFDGKQRTRREIAPPPGFEPPQQRGASMMRTPTEHDAASPGEPEERMEWPG
jgi:integrase